MLLIDKSTLFLENREDFVSEPGHIFGDHEGLMSEEELFMEDKHAILKLLSEPCDILWMSEIIKGTRGDDNWEFDRGKIIRWWMILTILGHIHTCSIVVPLE